MRRKLITVLAVVATVSALTTGAMAQETETTAGRLWAFGNGTAALDVDQGAVKLLAVGDVTISGPTGLDVVINSWFEDSGPEARGGGVDIVLADFAGAIAVKGQNYQITIDGVTTLHGAGSGSASFDGEGLWKTRRGQGQWPGFVSLTEDLAA